MLFLKRILTSLAAFAILTPILALGTLTVGGAITGAISGYASAPVPQVGFQKSFQEGYERGHTLGRAAGAKFGKQYGLLIIVCSIGLCLISSLVLSFGGAFPWCRRPLHTGL